MVRWEKAVAVVGDGVGFVGSRVVLRGVLARRSASEVLVELVMSASGVQRL